MEKMKRDYEIGSAKRKQELEKFQVVLAETLKKLEVADAGLEALTTAAVQKELEINAIKINYQNQRFELVLNTIASFASSEGVKSGLTGIFEPLSNNELMQFIIHTCQLNGEMDNVSSDDTCVPLRLAGVDVGLLWEGENFDECSAVLVRAETKEQKLHLADLVHKNAEGEPVWMPIDGSPSTGRKARRRLEDYPGDDSYNDEDAEDISDDEDIELQKAASNNEVHSDAARALRDSVEQAPFSRSRIDYIKRATALVETIDAVMKDVNSDSDIPEETEEPRDLGFDPMAYRLTRNTLTQREKHIENGFDFAVSATILLNSIVTNEDKMIARNDLIRLAGATLFHSDVSSEHVWQILNYIIPEFEVSLHVSEQTCASPLATLCPVKVVNRNGIQIPPSSITEAGEATCKKAVEEASTGICAPIVNEIPTSVPNGFFGYFVVSPRATQDVVEQAMMAFDKLEDGRSLTDEAEDQMKQLQQQRTDLEKELKELDDLIGGRHESRFGPNGELASFNNACHSVITGKYEYEVCVFGQALQKEKGKNGGTSLGHWTGMHIDHETGDISFKWENGLKCWNGPHRSATVNLRCGADNKVLSADEPDTCRYVLAMESHLACHERYFERNFA